eukprot:TRINITY_DN179_c0_g1_i4.p1 TRINITY_DN179_c0_g1~~TRINITY_DN179_c0_g1_i4.p1  ORF type:complete len:316 (-),score=86.85 TRINITY_DN179_c0_g1_i4:709-1656(-)
MKQEPKTIMEAEDVAAKEAKKAERKVHVPIMLAEQMVERQEASAESKEEDEAYREEEGVEREVEKEDSKEAQSIHQEEMREAERAEKYEQGVMAPVRKSEQEKAQRIRKAEMEAEKIARTEAEENYVLKPDNAESTLGENPDASSPLNDGEREILDTLGVMDGMEGVDDEDTEDDLDLSSLSQFAALPESLVASTAPQLMPWREQSVGSDSIMHEIQPFTEEELAVLVLSQSVHERRRLFFKSLFGDYGQIGRMISRTASEQIQQESQKSRLFEFRWRKLRDKILRHCKKSSRFRKALRARVLAKIEVLVPQYRR